MNYNALFELTETCLGSLSSSLFLQGDKIMSPPKWFTQIYTDAIMLWKVPSLTCKTAGDYLRDVRHSNPIIWSSAFGEKARVVPLSWQWEPPSVKHLVKHQVKQNHLHNPHACSLPLRWWNIHVKPPNERQITQDALVLLVKCLLCFIYLFKTFLLHLFYGVQKAYKHDHRPSNFAAAENDSKWAKP